MHASPADALDQAPRSGAVEDNPEGSRYIQISDTLAKVLANQIRDRVTYLLEANNTELARRRGFEAEANQSHCDVLLLGAECHRLRELNGILSAFVEECHANGGEDVPREIREVMDAVFPRDVTAMDSTRVQAKPETPTPHDLAERFRSQFYVRGDHTYSGIEIYKWLQAQLAKPATDSEGPTGCADDDSPLMQSIAAMPNGGRDFIARFDSLTSEEAIAMAASERKAESPARLTCKHCGKPIHDNGTVYVHDGLLYGKYIIRSQWCSETNRQTIAEPAGQV